MPKSKGRKAATKSKKRKRPRRESLFAGKTLGLALDRADDLLLEGQEMAHEAMPEECRTPMVTDGATAQTLLHRARVSAEHVGLEYAEAMGTYSWLFYLRRISTEILKGNISSTAPYRMALAELLSSFTSAPESYDPEYKRNFVPPIDSAAAEALLRLCGVAIALQGIHSSIRRAGKDQRIQFHSNEFPTHVPDSSVDERINLYDLRVIDGDGQFGENGLEEFYPVLTPLSDPVRISELILTLSFRDPAGIVPQWTGPLTRPRAKFTTGRYIVGGTSLAGITRMNRLASKKSPWADDSLASLILFLRVMFKLVHTNDLGFGVSLPNVGYFVLPYSLLVDLSGLEIAQAGFDLEAMGLHNIPSDPASMLEKVTNLPVSLWPPTPGPVMRRAGEQTIVDISTASRWLRELLTVSNEAGDSMIHARADHFELFVQNVIDNSYWRPPAEIQQLRGRTLRISGKNITDLDAVAVKGDRLLLVSCKSMPYTRELDAGVHSKVRNVRSALKKYDEEWLERVETIRRNPRGDNFDLSNFEVMGVVCVPFVPYTDLQQTRVLHTSGSSALRAVCSVNELRTFLSA